MLLVIHFYFLPHQFILLLEFIYKLEKFQNIEYIYLFHYFLELP